MITDISKLTSQAGVWDTTSVIASAFVLLGVVLESVADFDTLARLTGLASRHVLKDNIAKAGLLILIAALAVEVIAAIGSHDANGKIIAVLNAELDTTIRHDLELTKLTHGLELSNSDLKQKLKMQDDTLYTMSAQSDEFKIAMDKQKSRNDATLRELNKEAASLKSAQRITLNSANASARAAQLAGKTAANISATLEAERKMQEQMRAIVTHRELSADQISELADKLRPFAKTSFDINVNQDADSTRFASQLASALEQAGWVWKESKIAGTFRWTIPGKPSMGIVSLKGIYLEVAESRRPLLEQTLFAMEASLLPYGIRIANFVAPPDDKLYKAYDVDSVHITIGSRD